jgi:hypothetical protein
VETVSADCGGKSADGVADKPAHPLPAMLQIVARRSNSRREIGILRCMVRIVTDLLIRPIFLTT